MPVSSDKSGEYGAAADVYRQIARNYNQARLAHPKYPQEGDTSLVAITLSTVNGVPVPYAWGLYDYNYARQWWYGHMPRGIFYAALFDNNFYPRYPPKLLREYLKDAKWVGPMPYSPI